MRVAVTGATGNVGTAVVRALTARDHEVVGLARRPPGPSTDPSSPSYAGVEWHSVDLTRSPGAVLRRAFRDADAVVHLAWGFQPTRDEAYLEQLGVGGTREVIAAVADARVGQLAHMSSLGVYSAGTGLADETWPTEGIPTSAYSRHKVAAERLLDVFEPAHPDTVVTRMRPVLIGQRRAAAGMLRYVLPAGVPRSAIRLAKVVPMDRDMRLQFVHADDVADAFVRALEARAGGAFNLAADPVLTPADIAAVLGGRIREGAYDDTPILRQRTVVGGLVEALRGRSQARRHRP
jgi:nucleoside-diphosphate-sugar epimerase